MNFSQAVAFRKLITDADAGNANCDRCKKIVMLRYEGVLE